MQIKTWGDKSVVYHPESGNTYLLTTHYAQILELILSGLEEISLVAAVSSETGVESSEDAKLLITQAKETFTQLNLISK